MPTAYTQKELLEQADALIKLLDAFIAAPPRTQDRMMVDLELFPHAMPMRPEIEPGDYGLMSILVPEKLDTPLADLPVPERTEFVRQLRDKAVAWRQEAEVRK